MIFCPKCGEEMQLTVLVEITIPARYLRLLSKEVIRKKECQLTAAMWDDAKIFCPNENCNAG
jgi:hypothetical protein